MKVEINNVSKEYGGVKALDQVSLEIGKGVFGILGPNGAGKTTLMRILMTLIQKDGGQITIDGTDLEDHKMIRSKVSYLPQEFSFYPNMKVFEAMEYMALLNEVSHKKEHMNDLLARVNLMPHRRKKVKELSGGMKRRLGIAMSLLKDPKVLIVDEPTAGLDPEERVKIRNLLSQFAQDRIVLLSTHIVGDIEHTCENIAILNQGQIIFNGKKGQVLERAKGKVRLLKVSQEALTKIQEQYYVAAIHSREGYYEVKVITDEAVGEVVTPNLEDAYLYTIQSKSDSITRKSEIVSC